MMWCSSSDRAAVDQGLAEPEPEKPEQRTEKNLRMCRLFCKGVQDIEKACKYAGIRAVMGSGGGIPGERMHFCRNSEAEGFELEKKLHYCRNLAYWRPIRAW
ncbi:hypothetical protein DNH61_25400 [Paenibacillus sambharensis]|uniref:Uncharacterized protein n=1 Tax=Paenibacillus sambharensis TaxID=1803190 RepID=A0A2W1LF25_9BACL|nr:hypothetical protein DNH61_25400 [Paenibacillus sambharensis]